LHHHAPSKHEFDKAVDPLNAEDNKAPNSDKHGFDYLALCRIQDEAIGKYISRCYVIKAM